MSRIATWLRCRAESSGGPYSVGCSIGAVTCHDVPRGTAAALDAADKLMYDAKREGGNDTVFEIVASRDPGE